MDGGVTGNFSAKNTIYDGWLPFDYPIAVIAIFDRFFEGIAEKSPRNLDRGILAESTPAPQGYSEGTGNGSV
jgi:hypothetical protein